MIQSKYKSGKITKQNNFCSRQGTDDGIATWDLEPLKKKLIDK